MLIEIVPCKGIVLMNGLTIDAYWWRYSSDFRYLELGMNDNNVHKIPVNGVFEVIY